MVAIKHSDAIKEHFFGPGVPTSTHIDMIVNTMVAAAWDRCTKKGRLAYTTMEKNLTVLEETYDELKKNEDKGMKDTWVRDKISTINHGCGKLKHFRNIWLKTTAKVSQKLAADLEEKESELHKAMDSIKHSDRKLVVLCFRMILTTAQRVC